LDKEPESRKEKAINLAKQHGYKIKPLNINYSESTWKIEGEDTLIAPLTGIKGFGDAAFEQVLQHRPFDTIDELLFHDDVKYSKLNKKALDVLCRSGALEDLIDERFTGDKHFWSAAVVDRPKNRKRFDENIEKYRPEGSFTEDEKIGFLADLTGIFPVSMVMSQHIMDKLDAKGVPPISEYDQELMFCWGIIRSVTKKKTKNGKHFFVVKVIDSNSVETQIRCTSYQQALYVETKVLYRLGFLNLRFTKQHMGNFNLRRDHGRTTLSFRWLNQRVNIRKISGLQTNRDIFL